MTTQGLEELRTIIRREVVKAQYGTIGELTDELVKSMSVELTKARLDGAKNVQRMIKNSPDPRTDIEKYIRRLEDGSN